MAIRKGLILIFYFRLILTDAISRLILSVTIDIFYLDFIIILWAAFLPIYCCRKYTLSTEAANRPLIKKVDEIDTFSQQLGFIFSYSNKLVQVAILEFISTLQHIIHQTQARLNLMEGIKNDFLHRSLNNLNHIKMKLQIAIGIFTPYLKL